jgi:hypothetical protein
MIESKINRVADLKGHILRRNAPIFNARLAFLGTY